MNEKKLSLGEYIQTKYLEARNKISARPITIKGINETTAADGGNLVTAQLLGPILQSTLQKSVLLKQAKKLRIDSTVTRGSAKIPVVVETTRTNTSAGKMWYWMNEAATLTNDMPVWGQASLTLHKVACMLPVTEEIMQDSKLLESWIDVQVTDKLAIEMDRAMLYGTPTVSMTGVLSSNTVSGVIEVAVGNTSNTIAEAIFTNFTAALAPAAMPNAQWYMSKTIHQNIMANATTYMNKHELVIDNGKWYFYGYPMNCMEQFHAGGLILGDFTQYVVVDQEDPMKTISFDFAFGSDQIYMKWIYRANGTSFGQAYTLQDGSVVGTFITPSLNA